MEENWTEVIEPNKSLFNLNFKELWKYRDLILIFVRRDIVSVYKQTVLGPLWFFLGPLFTVFTFVFVFSQIAKISTDNIPAPLFYLAGTTLWNYFQACLSGTSSTFISNAGIFGKVYFPRLVSPISMVISNLLKFGIQLLMFLGLLLLQRQYFTKYLHFIVTVSNTFNGCNGARNWNYYIITYN